MSWCYGVFNISILINTLTGLAFSVGLYNEIELRIKRYQKWCMYHIREHTVLLKANVTLTHFLSIKYYFESIKLLVVACVNSNSHVLYAWWLYPLSIEHWSTQISASYCKLLNQHEWQNTSKQVSVRMWPRAMSLNSIVYACLEISTAQEAECCVFIHNKHVTPF